MTQSASCRSESEQNGKVETTMLLIQNAHILPIVGDEIENGSLLLDQGKIAAIGTQLPVPPGAEVIDAQGRLARW